jgi:hypothetical protein
MAKESTYSRRTSEQVTMGSTVNETTTKHNTAPLLFNRDNYIWIAGGFGLVLLGLLLMSGGGMTDPKVWDESVIYSFRRITLAPMVILAGLIVEIYAIFIKK